MMKERIEYVISKSSGKDVFVGRSVNYHVVAQASDIDELKRKMKTMVELWLKHGTETMNQEDPIEMKEVTSEEWESEYKEQMNTGRWVHIANELYDTIRDLVGDDWNNAATEKYEKNTTRKAITDKLGNR